VLGRRISFLFTWPFLMTILFYAYQIIIFVLTFYNPYYLVLFSLTLTTIVWTMFNLENIVKFIERNEEKILATIQVLMYLTTLLGIVFGGLIILKIVLIGLAYAMESESESNPPNPPNNPPEANTPPHYDPRNDFTAKDYGENDYWNYVRKIQGLPEKTPEQLGFFTKWSQAKKHNDKLLIEYEKECNKLEEKFQKGQISKAKVLEEKEKMLKKVIENRTKLPKFVEEANFQLRDKTELEKEKEEEIAKELQRNSEDELVQKITQHIGQKIALEIDKERSTYWWWIKSLFISKDTMESELMERARERFLERIRVIAKQNIEKRKREEMKKVVNDYCKSTYGLPLYSVWEEEFEVSKEWEEAYYRRNSPSTGPSSSSSSSTSTGPSVEEVVEVGEESDATLEFNEDDVWNFIPEETAPNFDYSSENFLEKDVSLYLEQFELNEFTKEFLCDDFIHFYYDNTYHFNHISALRSLKRILEDIKPDQKLSLTEMKNISQLFQNEFYMDIVNQNYREHREDILKIKLDFRTFSGLNTSLTRRSYRLSIVKKLVALYSEQIYKSKSDIVCQRAMRATIHYFDLYPNISLNVLSKYYSTCLLFFSKKIKS